MLNRDLIGRKTGPVVYEVEAWHVERFAQACGDTNPVYRDEAAARAAGHPRIPAPTTFAAALRPEDPRSELGIDFRRIVHGEQSYELCRPLYVGDIVHVVAHISDIYEKTGKNGTLAFVVMDVEGRTPTGEVLYSARSTTVVRP
jgi:acyl dehydratase